MENSPAILQRDVSATSDGLISCTSTNSDSSDSGSNTVVADNAVESIEINSFNDARSSYEDRTAAPSQQNEAKSKSRSTKSKKKRSLFTSSLEAARSIVYRGVTINRAAEEGNLPVCVLLWGMASARKINLMVPDEEGCNPIHYASIADSSEVLSFLIQQTRGVIEVTGSEHLLVETRNHSGETSVLKAAAFGRISVIKALFTEHFCDPFAADQEGNNILINCCKNGHLWCLNYIFKYLSENAIYGRQTALKMLRALDIEGHSCLDWAADFGDLNTIEYLIRNGLSPYRVDAFGRSALYWAVRRRRISAVRLLVRLGCDIHATDSNNQTPFKIALSFHDSDLLSAISCRPFFQFESLNYFMRRVEEPMAEIQTATCFGSPSSVHVSMSESTVQGASSETPWDKVQVNPMASTSRPPAVHVNFDISYPKPPMVITMGTHIRSHVIDIAERYHGPLRLVYVFLYGGLVSVAYILSILITFWPWIVVVSILVYGFRHCEIRVGNSIRSRKTSSIDSMRAITLWEKIVSAREKYVGVYVGNLFSYLLYIVMSINDAYDDSLDNSSPDARAFILNGISGFKDDFTLFCIVAILIEISVVLWIMLVTNIYNPGIVDTRNKDFDEIMDDCYRSCEPSPNASICRTSLVKKPLRSKYCLSTGLVIARMDHYCQWLNNVVGYGNQRLFILFLYFHFITFVAMATWIARALNREIVASSETTCTSAEMILSRLYFFPFLVTISSVVAAIFTFGLCCEQTINMFMNLTTNERLNKGRYNWLLDDNGNYFNRFDRGYVANFLEFWGVPGYAIDYRTVFALPAVPARDGQGSLLSTAELASHLETSNYSKRRRPISASSSLTETDYSRDASFISNRTSLSTLTTHSTSFEVDNNHV